MPRRGEDADEAGASAPWIVLRHTAAEGLGLLANVLREFGIQHRSLDLARGDPPPKDIRELGGVIVLGGPMAAYEGEKHSFLDTECRLIEQAITAGRPALGICLGAQLIAQVLGGRVYRGNRREVGWAPITLTDAGRDDICFGGPDESPIVFHMHGDTYEPPADATNLARSEVYEQQAFRWGDVVYGLQFHLEFTDEMITRLATEADSRRFLQESGVDTDALLSETPGRVRDLSPFMEQVFSEYFRRCGL